MLKLVHKTILIVLASFSIFLILFDLFIKPIEQLLLIIITIYALMLAIIDYQLRRLKIFHEIFEYFNERYDKMNNDLNRLVKGLKINKCIQNNLNEDEEIFENRLIVYDYLNLCAEEYYWYRKGLINKRVWNNWLSGMRYFLKDIFILKIILEERKDCNIKDSYYGFLESDIINKILINNCDQVKTN
jgi:ABC-type multidrug transport system fused ATPase/permease subunit